jgi:ATP-binding cassette subfamily F protein uup
MIDKLCDHILVLVGDGTVKDITGNYTSWRSNIQQKEIKQVKAKVERIKTDQPKTKLTFKEKMEFEAIEKRMPEIEEEKAVLEGQIAEGPSVDDLITMSEKLGKLTEELNEIELRWLELSEYT